MSKIHDEKLMEKIQTLCKNRGFVFQAGELYGGLAGVYDYGPLGSLLKKNIKDSWIKKFVHDRHDMFLLDSAILMGRAPLTASGHVDGFSDPLVDDVVTNKRYRADHLLEEAGVNPAGMSVEQMSVAIKEHGIQSPDGNDLGEVRQFNLMLQTHVGATESSSSVAYLRPETAQGIFINYKNIMDSMHPKVPFGVAQVGKAYRNEITPRNFIFRLRELEQMEIEYFINPQDWEAQFQYWTDEIQEWLTETGINPELLHQVEIGEDDRAHYSKRTIDFEFDYPFGQKELHGLAYRTDYDLKKHAEHSKTKLQYTDPFTNETYIPHVIEPSVGVERLFLALLVSAYMEDEVDGATRTYLKLPSHLAPYKIAVSPLVKNKEELVSKAQEVFGSLTLAFGNVSYDDNGNIGKRYRRQDEIGTPFCVVVDYQTLEDQTVSVRHRDTTEQVRVSLGELNEYFTERFAR
jgi:glycyl-tRNA synthetase